MTVLANARISNATCPARIELTEDHGTYVAVYQSKHICVKNSEREYAAHCPLCSKGFEKTDRMCRHLAAAHDVRIEDETLSFDSYEGK